MLTIVHTRVQCHSTCESEANTSIQCAGVVDSDSHINVYECVLGPPVTIGENSSVHIHQRYATRQIAFLHDGEKDTPLISVNITSE